MENKMDAQLIPNEELAEDALETPQPQQERPPSYPSTNAPAYSSGPPQPQYAPQPQGVYAPQPVQQGYIIQNIPVQQSPGCCSGRSEWFKHSVGVTTGVIQLVLAITASILSGVTIYLHIRSDMFGGPMGSPIGSAIFFFLPAGILGACSKNKSNCVIVAYLVMSILAAIQGAFVCVVQVVLAVVSVDFDNDDCYDIHRYPYPNDAIYPSEEVEDIFPDIGYSCGPVRNKCLTALHSVIAILMFIELIVAIVASAVCCGGLSCCCPRGSSQTNSQPMQMYSPLTGVQPLPAAQMGTHVVQGSELPAKA